MKQFLVLFLTPVSVLENWMKTEETERKATEATMQKEWGEWMETHKASIVTAPAGAGKTKLVNKEGISDTKNDVMMFAILQAATPEDAAAMFVGHPHLGIPEATIEIMQVNQTVGAN